MALLSSCATAREGYQMRLTIVLALLGIACAPLSAAELTVLYRESSPSVVFVETQDPFGNTKKYGTGFFVADGCTVVTNYHVIHGGYRIRYGADKNRGTILVPQVRVDREQDLAIIRVADCGKPLPLASSLPEIGEAVFAIGNPHSLNYSLSTGVISGLRMEGMRLLQTTAAISPGSSGGPLINMDGAVVGITTFYLAEGQNLNFAIAAQEIIELLGTGEDRSLAEEFPDRDDPLSVAAAFFFALHQHEPEKAISLVDRGQQTEFDNIIRSSPPSIPKNATLRLEEGQPIGGMPHAEVSIEGSSIGIDLVKYHDGWWVTR